VALIAKRLINIRAQLRGVSHSQIDHGCLQALVTEIVLDRANWNSSGFPAASEPFTQAVQKDVLANRVSFAARFTARLLS
jgi:hypothetical protein